MKKNLFSYGNGKRKLGHSHFDMSFNSLSTDNFGGLNCKAAFETIPDDFWYIGENALTKVKPMVCPPFTRIHQNWYAFYVRNQQIWKDWNNYITNGTAWGDVYGSNFTNQNRENPWKVPQLSANDLQLPLKIANGYALPVFRVIMSAEQVSSVFDIDFSDMHVQFQNRDSVIDHHANFVARFLVKNAGFDIPYVNLFLSASNYAFEFGGSYSQLDPLLRKLYPGRTSEFDPEPSTIGTDIDRLPDTSAYLYRNITYRLFSDYASNCSDLSKSPFYHTKSVRHSKYNGLDLNNYDFNIRKTRDDFMDLGIVDSSVLPLAEHFVYLQSDYFGLDVSVFCDNTSGYVTFYCDFRSDDYYYYSFRLPKSVCNIHEGAGFRLDCENFIRSLDGYFGVTTDHFYDFMDGLGDEPTTFGFNRIKTSNNSAYPIQSITTDNLYSLGSAWNCDLVLPVSVSTDVFDSDYLTMYAPFKFAPQSFLTDSMGYYSDAWLIYLCKQVSRHLDNMNIPIDALTCRSSQAYRFEFFNALPFFAYSKIWNDHFRNKALSCPEFDYSYTNGWACLDFDRSNYIRNFYERPGVLPEEFRDDLTPLTKTNGWVIPLCMLPKNSLPMDYTDLDGFRHFVSSQDHYFDVKNYYDLFAVLTGCCLDALTLRKQFRSFESHYNSAGTVDFVTFSSLYASKFYLPTYYNGLLHLKYQNFNSDYFTTGLLDPMSGANQVELGNTVNELRVNETKQSWYEKIVNARSISGFMRAIFGIDPIVEDTESRMLGSDHIDINIGEVIQTSQTDVTPQGTRSGLGQAHGSGSLVHNHTNEHGWIIILASHTVESQYMQGLEKMYLPKMSYMDYPTQDFENIGNESILQKEINYDVMPSLRFRDFSSYAPLDGSSDPNVTYTLSKVKYKAQGNPTLQSTNATLGRQDIVLSRNVAQSAGTALDNVFAFNLRFSTYKFKLDQCHGEFRNRLRFWQTFRQFNSQPVLSHEFINWELLADSEEFNRIFAVTEDEYDDKFLLDVFINATVDRALSYLSIPHSK